jgi:hypothetical protein
MSQRQAAIPGQKPQQQEGPLRPARRSQERGRLVERAQKRRCATNETQHKATAPFTSSGPDRPRRAISEHGLQFSKAAITCASMLSYCRFAPSRGERETLRLA